MKHRTVMLVLVATVALVVAGCSAAPDRVLGDCDRCEGDGLMDSWEPTEQQANTVGGGPIVNGNGQVVGFSPGVRIPTVERNNERCTLCKGTGWKR